jgi:monoamine oxidase
VGHRPQGARVGNPHIVKYVFGFCGCQRSFWHLQSDSGRLAVTRAHACPDTRLSSRYLLDRLASTLGLTSAEIDARTSHAWQDQPFAAGGYVAFAPGQLTRHGPALRPQLRRIHLGGADRSTWPGTMEGALRDAERLTHAIRSERITR